MPATTMGYDREQAVEYAHRWALSRNPRYYNFSGIGGDCANFASQCIHAGGGTMNYKPTFGWYYNSPTDRAPAWSSVKYLHTFLTTNTGPGPRAVETGMEEVETGDIIQIATYLEDFHHTLVVVGTGRKRDFSDILVSAHSYDCDNRPLTDYGIRLIRFLHITGIGRQ